MANPTPLTALPLTTNNIDPRNAIQTSYSAGRKPLAPLGSGGGTGGTTGGGHLHDPRAYGPNRGR